MYVHEEKKTALPPKVNKYTRKISVIDAVAIVVGLVVGPGIFKTPGIVAANSANEASTLSLWVIGGLISFIGALCYAELTSTYPNEGGEYYYLNRSFGSRLAFLFAWARMTVIQTGSIAMLSFLIGDYVSEVFRLGAYSSSTYAAITVVILTAVNLKGLKPSSKFQKILLSGIITGLLAIVIIGLTSSSVENAVPSAAAGFSIGQAMIFVLLTYGGWSEAAYLSAEVGDSRSNIIKVLFYSIGIITLIYVVTNYALIKGLGFANVAGSDAVAADLIAKTLGSGWVKIISFIVAIAAFSTVNAVMITGARTNYALGRDFRNFKFLSKWKEEEKAPANAFLFQSGIALLLILIGTIARDGFITMVEYTAPVFWFFLFMTGISLFVLRKKDSGRYRYFLVPFYPATPLIFCAVSLYMLYSSLVYTGTGAVIGVIVLIAGIPFIIYNNNAKRRRINYETQQQ